MYNPAALTGASTGLMSTFAKMASDGHVLGAPFRGDRAAVTAAALGTTMMVGTAAALVKQGGFGVFRTLLKMGSNSFTSPESTAATDIVQERVAGQREQVQAQPSSSPARSKEVDAVTLSKVPVDSGGVVEKVEAAATATGFVVTATNLAKVVGASAETVRKVADAAKTTVVAAQVTTKAVGVAGVAYTVYTFVCGKGSLLMNGSAVLVMGTASAGLLAVTYLGTGAVSAGTISVALPVALTALVVFGMVKDYQVNRLKASLQSQVDVFREMRVENETLREQAAYAESALSDTEEERDEHRDLASNLQGRVTRLEEEIQTLQRTLRKNQKALGKKNGELEKVSAKLKAFEDSVEEAIDIKIVDEASPEPAVDFAGLDTMLAAKSMFPVNFGKNTPRFSMGGGIMAIVRAAAQTEAKKIGGSSLFFGQDEPRWEV